MLKRVVLGLFVAAALAPSAMAACADHKIWDGILRANVDADGFVDYDAIRINKGGDLLEYTAFLETANLSQCSEEERLAFWINAYSAHMVRQVLARPQMKKVEEDFKLFGEKFKVARLDLSLNDIEHRVLRSAKNKGGPIPNVSLPKLDPRIHFALVCAAIDCPKLLNRAYQPATIDEQLQGAAVAFANNPKHLRLEDGQLVLTTLMKWYREDFDAAGGVPAYLANLTDPALRADEKEIDARLASDFPGDVDFRYDWTLNSVKNKPKK